MLARATVCRVHATAEPSHLSVPSFPAAGGPVPARIRPKAEEVTTPTAPGSPVSHLLSRNASWLPLPYSSFGKVTFSPPFRVIKARRITSSVLPRMK